MAGCLSYMNTANADVEDVPLGDLSGPPLVFGETPLNGLEAEVLEAMKLSLDY